MLINHSYMDHRYSTSFAALFLMTLNSRVHAQGGDRVKIGDILNFYLFFHYYDQLRMAFCFPSRTEDLTLNVRDQVLD